MSFQLVCINLFFNNKIIFKKLFSLISEMVNDGRFTVSGWEGDLDDIDESRNPNGKKIITLLFKSIN